LTSIAGGHCLDPAQRLLLSLIRGRNADVGHLQDGLAQFRAQHKAGLFRDFLQPRAVGQAAVVIGLENAVRLEVGNEVPEQGLVEEFRAH